MSVVSIYGKKDGNVTIYQIPCFVLVEKSKEAISLGQHVPCHVPDFEGKGKISTHIVKRC
jgi:polyribonucleotide nucleotidyltransferase